MLIVFNSMPKSSAAAAAAAGLICVAHLVARVASIAAAGAVCLQQFRSAASVRLDDFMENFIEQAETISFGAINVVRCTGWWFGGAAMLTAAGKWVSAF